MAPAPTGSRDRKIGRLIKDTYVLEARIGIGGFGAVYRARHVKLGSAVAVKFLLPHADDLARLRFEREARIAAAIVHPNVARVIDVDHDDEDSPFIVLEWIDGASLRAMINDRGAFSLADTLDLFKQFCSAMEAAHATGVVHRDLKPENILVSGESPSLILKVLDFGVARSEGSRGTLTDGVAVGTPCYMAPESAHFGSSNADRRVDIYAMGLLLYECLTGKRAIDGEPMQVFALQLTTGITIPSVRAVNADLPPEIDLVIAKACARNPVDRYATAAELGAALVPKVVAPPAPHWSQPSPTPPGRPRQPTPARPSPAGGPRLPTPAPAAEVPLIPSEEIDLVAESPSLPTPLPPRASPTPPSSDLQTPRVVALPRATPAPAALPLASHIAPPLTPGPRARSRTLLLVGVAVAVAVVVAGGGVFFATRPAKVVAPPPRSPTVRWRLTSAPPGVRVFNAAARAGSPPLPIEDGALLLRRSDRPLRLRFEAPGFRKTPIEIIPDADGELDFGAFH